jgi:hypothetical protein
MRSSYSKWLPVVGACLALGTYSACGDDDSGGTAGASGHSGSGGAKAGTGGAGGKGGTGGGKAGSGGSGGSAAVTCGGMACAVDPILMMVNPAVKACCTTNNKCGATNTANACLENNAPGVADPSCPTVSVMFGGMTYPQAGCCTPSGKCGGNFAQVSYGCVPYELLTADMGGPLDAKACSPDGGTADAGY